MQFRDYYETLGVQRDASQEDIKRAYRKLSKKYHPDINKASGAEDRFKQVGEAYEVLKDPEKRRRYDQLGRGYQSGQDFRPPPGWQNVEFNFGGRGASDVPGGFSDFFEAFFGGAGRAGARGRPSPYGSSADGAYRRPGQAQEAEITISLEDAYNGVTRPITLQQTITGADGGRRADERAFQVKIPPGTTSGTKIRLAGQGGKGLGGAPDGDLLLKVNLAPHPRFELDGHDLKAVLPIAPWEALFGAKVGFSTLDGEVQIKVPPGSQGGARLRLKDKGLPRRDGSRGSLTLELRVVVPQHPSDEERRLYEQLQRAASASGFDPRGPDPRRG